MDLTNINKNLQIDSTQNDTGLFFNTDTSTPVPTKSTTNPINTNFTPSLDNELSEEMQKNVEFKPSQDIVQEKTAYLSLQEQERMQKMQQKELLITLQKSNSNKATNYSRNMDEAVLMNSQKKDFDNYSSKNTINPLIQKNDYLEDTLNIDSASEEFYEEFLNPQKRKKNDDPESSLKQFEERKQKKDNEKQKKKKTNYFFEDDEVIDLEELPEEQKEELEDFIINFTSNPNKTKLRKFNPKFEQEKINPALKKALRKDHQKHNNNKLRQKFNKK